MSEIRSTHTLSPARSGRDDADSPTHNPNRGRFRVGRLAQRVRSNGEKGTHAARTGVTVVRCDPAYLARYGADAAMRRANENRRSGETVGQAQVIARNVRRRSSLKSL